MRREQSSRVRSKAELARRLRVVSPQGDQSRSTALGPDDPRHRRGAQAVRAFATRYTDQFRTRGDGRLAVELIEGQELRAGGYVEDLLSSATAADVRDKVNELLAALRAAGLMEGRV